MIRIVHSAGGGFIAYDTIRKGLSAYGDIEIKALKEFLVARKLWIETERSRNAKNNP